MRKIYVGLVFLIMLAVLAQFYFAAVGAFDKPQDDASYTLHSVNGMMIIPILSVLATIVAAIAKVPGRLIGLSILPLVLVMVQMLINGVGGHGNDHTTPAGQAILGLHAINGLLILAVARELVLRGRALMRSAAPAVGLTVAAATKAGADPTSAS